MQRFQRFWKFVRTVLVPALLVSLAVLTLREPVAWWLRGEEKYDREALKEWLLEAKIYQTLPEVVGDYLQMNERFQELEALSQTRPPIPEPVKSEHQHLPQKLRDKREEIYVYLESLGDPTTKIYRDRLPLFMVVYSLAVRFDDKLNLPPIVWDSLRPRQPSQYKELKGLPLDERGAIVDLQYQLRVYARQQYNEHAAVARWLRLSGLTVVFATVALVWVYLAQRRANESERQRVRQRQQVSEAERLRLQEELRRQEAERRREEAERTALELKSQLFANIGIMAGSYAHNIKNLLLRPNDLLRRCLEADGISANQGHMLEEVRQTLGTVTERLQQILQTVRRDPNQSERVRLDLNELIGEVQRTWGEMAREKWKLVLTLELAPQPLWIEGDHSHLQQALENLLFNARDATFEMRNYLREQARQAGAQAPSKREAMIAAAAWKGEVVLRTLAEGDQAILEVRDNGIGMTEEVRRRCTETHFSTKRDNALFAGLSAGMGLGLSFVVVILEHHRATLEIESEPLRGTTFRVSFPLLVE